MPDKTTKATYIEGQGSYRVSKPFPDAKEMRDLRLNYLPIVVDNQKAELAELVQRACHHGMIETAYDGELYPCVKEMLVSLGYSVTEHKEDMLGKMRVIYTIISWKE